jgi:hypothetical protein
VTAKVATSIVVGDARRSGRNARAMRSERATVQTTAITMLAALGQPFVSASVYPAAVRSDACAKLTSRMTPKTSPMPIATRAKIAPWAIASMSDCKTVMRQLPK